MSLSALFPNGIFNTASLPTNAVIFNDNGLIDPGPLTNPAPIGYNTTVFNDYLNNTMIYGGYGHVVSDIGGTFPGAIYHIGISSAQTVVDGNGNATTTYIIDNGIAGTADSDVVADMSGDNIINTGDGNDFILTGFDNDAIRAGRGDDIVFSGGGNDVVDAQGGNDIVYLFDGDDIARGRGGHDELVGEAGNDMLFGEGGRDTLDGGTGSDTLDGGNGRDVLIGGSDNDVLTGGNGRDTFVFAVGSGEDIITDFDAARDTIEMEVAQAADFAAINSVAQQIGSDLVLRLTSGDDIVLEDTMLADLSANNFEFV